MFNPFKSKNEAPQSRETVAVIEEIHNAFDIAADQALAEANAILSREFSPKEEELGKDLLRLGFTKVPLAEKVSSKVEDDTKAKKRADTVQKYQQKYPQYKFIFLDQVIAICEKYGLVFGTSEQYKGDIPAKNIKEISKFEVLPEDKYYHRQDLIIWGGGEGVVDSIRYNREWAFYSTEKLKCRGIQELEGSFFDKTTHFKPVPFLICAPKNDMLIDKTTKQEGVFLTKEYPDPIVLHYVKDGFLVASKWGIEGEDPALTNEKMN